MAQTVGEYRFYQYSSLPSENCMRVLELLSGHADNIINCTLHQVALDIASSTSPRYEISVESVPQQYEAISYVWGDPSRKVDVLCSGKIIPVTQNLKDALLQFKLKDRSRFVWADAICINQNDNVEKSSQVKLMNRIYANATRVCVWLGYPTVEMEPAFQFIDKMESYVNSTSIHQAELLQEHSSECWSALVMFFSAAWFSRLWVVQEVYGHASTVFCGEYETDWKNIIMLAKLLLKMGVDDPSVCPLPTNAISALQIDSAGHQSSISDVMDRFRDSQCSDQRDKVYALLSFPPLCGLQPLILPDYSKTVAEVFEEAAGRIIVSSQNLGLLSSHEHICALDEEWPSWVPRWDRQRQTQILSKYTSGRVQSSLPVIKYAPKTLILQGVRISTVSWCGAVIERTMQAKSEIDTLKQPLQEWLSNYISIVAHPTDSLLLCIAMTLTVGLDFDSNCPPLDMPQFRIDFLAYLIGILPSLSIPEITRQALEVLAEPGRAGNASHFYSAALRGCKNKRIFSTQNGEFGIGPRAGQIGDHIALFYSGNAPYVLRPRGSYYQFVGECYLHQHMHGEAIEMTSRGLFVVEEFEIR